MNKQFSAHGYCEIEVADNIIYIDAFGPWNEEYFEILHQKLMATRGLVDQNNFGVYLQPKGEAIATVNGVTKHTAFLMQSKVKVVAINLSECDTKFVTKDLCARIYTSCDIKHQFFDDKDQAQAWLGSFIQTVD
ncbi:hypothetical protein LP316_00620 [Thalassotalea sp. LPB0316]|uniref:hypothetical protein n=1 Tax=Thalassotalea sp. LPB0316 TaxID=2769490 RepID=UPI001868E07F|nr:hypothetical protein [Thalassotalea sp. LPB0316]QOL25857.1 hypothetical protein LP316_00620 [Thalassotalea sp. LPB0316]